MHNRSDRTLTARARDQGFEIATLLIAKVPHGRWRIREQPEPRRSRQKRRDSPEIAVCWTGRVIIFELAPGAGSGYLQSFRRFLG